MENGSWGVASDGISHQRSFKVIIQGHVTKKGDLTKNCKRVCAWYHWIYYVLWSMENGC